MLYLPISSNSIDKLICTEEVSQIELAIDSFSIPEIAALLVIQKIPSLIATSYKPDIVPVKSERCLYDFIKISKDTPKSYINTKAAQLYDKEGVLKGLELLQKNNIYLLPDSEVALKEYIDSNGDWVWGYKSTAGTDFFENPFLQRYFFRHAEFSHDQNRILNVFLTNQDESLDISGYAGTGKTRLISCLVDTLKPDGLLLLAMNKQQLSSMSKRLNRTVKALTFGELAKEILESNLLNRERRVGNRSNYKFTVSDTELAHKMEHHSLGNLTPMMVATVVRRTVNQFCYSADEDILVSHIPDEAYWKISPDHKFIIIALAKELWETILSPIKKNVELPVRGYHRIKQLQLSHEPIPKYYTHIIVDESHDLTKPIIEILDRSPQSVLTFGDRYQALNSLQVSNRRGTHIRHRQMSHSLRAGENTSNLYNNIIAYHPLKPDEPFEGSQHKITKINYYSEFSMPLHYCLILSKNNWHVFNIMQRLSTAGARFQILKRAYGDLKWLIGEAIAFYQENIKPTHPELRLYKTWEEFVSKQHDPIFEKIHRLFERGYKSNDFETALNFDIGLQRELDFSSMALDCYVLGRIEDSKNMEFSRVMLMQDTLSLTGNSKYDKSNLINHIYTGISRATDELIIPAYLEDWIKENLHSEPEVE